VLIYNYASNTYYASANHSVYMYKSTIHSIQ